MLRLQTVILVLLCCLVFSEIEASVSIRLQKKVVVSNPEKYLNIVLESEFIKSIENWELVSAEHPFYLDDKDSLVYVNLKFKQSMAKNLFLILI